VRIPLSASLSKKRWRWLVASELSARKLVGSHTEHKDQILAPKQSAYRRMGKLVAGAGSAPINELTALYAAELVGALSRWATRRSHTGFVTSSVRRGELTTL
jgi:uncharacterized protein YbgA (DUF1722 family)